jgi:hypothetical protein
MKWTLTVAIILLLLFSGVVTLGGVHAETTFHGVISSDTTWTKANSPIVLDGPVGVKTGVTLTIEPGVVIEGGYYIQVNGTLRCQGTSGDPIVYDHGEFRFMQTSQNSLIEYTHVYLIAIYDCSPKITNNQIGGETNDWTGGIRIYGGSPIITDNEFDQTDVNVIIGIVVNDGAPTITDNILTRVTINGGSSTISKNTINRGIDLNGGSVLFTNNKVIGPYSRGATPKNFYDEHGVSVTATPDFEVFGNLVSGWPAGIITYGSSAQVTLNHNLVVDNDVGVEIHGKVTLTSNTLRNNDIAIKAESGAQATLRSNNIEGSGNYSVYFDSTQASVDAANNWWGTADESAIVNSFFDSNKDFTLPTVNYTPYLTAPNSDAPTSTDDLPVHQTPTATPPPESTTPPVEPTDAAAPNQQATASPSNSQSDQQSNSNSEPLHINVYLIGVGVAVTLGVILLIIRVGYRQNKTA